MSGKYLRSCKYDVIKNTHDVYQANSHPLRFEEISGGVISPGDIPNVWNSCVFTPEGNPVTFAAEEYDLHIMPVMPEGEIRHSNERVLYAGYLNPHWGHFLVDSLPNLWGAFSSEIPPFDKIIFTAPENWDKTIHENIMETLTLSGLMDKIEVISEAVKYASVIVPEKGIIANERIGRETAAVFDTIALQAMKDAKDGKAFGKKIFLSRQAFRKSNKSEPGSEWLDTFLATNGFEIIYPEKKGISDLIRIIRNAEIIATISGTISHNMLFAAEGQKLWIFERSPIVNKHQEGINILRNLDVTNVDSNAQIWTISYGSGPFIIYPNDIFMRFASDHSLRGAQPWSEKKRRQILRRYFRTYKRIWGYEWILDKWDEAEIPSMRQAYNDTMRDFGQWLSGAKPLTLSDLLSPRRIIKSLFHKKC